MHVFGRGTGILHYHFSYSVGHHSGVIVNYLRNLLSHFGPSGLINLDSQAGHSEDFLRHFVSLIDSLSPFGC